MIDFYFTCSNCNKEIKCPTDTIPKNAYCPHCSVEVHPEEIFNKEQEKIKLLKRAKETAEEQAKENKLLEQLNKQSFTKAHLKHLEKELHMLKKFDESNDLPWLEPDKSTISACFCGLGIVVASCGIISTTILADKHGFLAFLVFVSTIISCFCIYCFDWVLHQIRVSNTLKKQQLLLLTIIRNSLFNH